MLALQHDNEEVKRQAREFQEERDRLPLLIVAEDVESDGLATLIRIVCAIKALGFGENRKFGLQDLAVLTVGGLIAEELGLKLEKVDLDMLGSCQKIYISKDDTVILDGAGDKKAIGKRCEQERLTKLSGGVAVLKVYLLQFLSEAEVGEKKDRVTGALNATKVVVEEGIVPGISGGGVALLYAPKELDKLPSANFDIRLVSRLSKIF
ncbi:hypothetical protein VNO80_11882 [Phaseolus coccineus]|uniref:Uncharacterized protein n=1 Tax=Phaseolus coccineus TaxID=3886 RepID=A0AAN9NCF3_PHACN